MIIKRKVYAYIVQDDDLVVFAHPDSPEAGIQVPGGTVEEDELLQDAVLREAFEETGLGGLSIVRYLGEQVRDMRDYGKDEMHHRYFFQLACETTIPQAWDHMEKTPSGGGIEPIRLAFYRAPLNNLPALIADFDRYTAELKEFTG